MQKFENKNNYNLIYIPKSTKKIKPQIKTFLFVGKFM